MEDRFVIFEVKSGASRSGDFGFNPAAEEPPEVEVHVETLEPSEQGMSGATRRVVAAPLFPTS